MTLVAVVSTKFRLRNSSTSVCARKIIVCEYCGRIMIDPELAGVETEKHLETKNEISVRLPSDSRRRDSHSGDSFFFIYALQIGVTWNIGEKIIRIPCIVDAAAVVTKPVAHHQVIHLQHHVVTG